MYGILMLLTLIAFIAIGDVIIVTSFEKDKHGKKHPWRLLWFISLIVTLFIFDKTGSFTNYKEVAKHLDKKWYVVYENNINADVTVTSGDMKLNPKKLITKDDTEKFLKSDESFLVSLFSSDDTNEYSADVTITTTNKNDSTSKDATLTKDNFIEKWPKGVNHNKSKGRITKIEYRSTPITLKWFGIPVQKTSYNEARITVEYGATGDESTAQLFDED